VRSSPEPSESPPPKLLSGWDKSHHSSFIKGVRLCASSWSSRLSDRLSSSLLQATRAVKPISLRNPMEHGVLEVDLAKKSRERGVREEDIAQCQVATIGKLCCEVKIVPFKG
jgi:hypothetical protein